MSYYNMDHAAWVQNCLTVAQKRKQTAKDRRAAADGKGWFAAPAELNPFHRRAFDILGMVGGGIYNAPISWDTVVWHERFVIVAWGWHSLSTWDFQGLTRFVFLCHEARIRGDISPAGFHHLRIALHERVADRHISIGHPNMEEALASFRADLPANSPIIYRVQKPEAA